MANNALVEAHCPQTINRSLMGDSEIYRQCDYQTFQMLVLSVVNQTNCV